MNLIRSIFFYLLFLFTQSFTSDAQRWTREISTVKTQLLKYDRSHYPLHYSIPFKKIEVIDYRFDTTKIGYATYSRPDNHTRLVIAGGIQDFFNNHLNDYFKNNLDPSSSKTLIIVLKKLWLQYGSTNQMLYGKDLNQGSKLSLANRNAVCLTDIDVFVESGITCQALVRLTHNFTIDKTGRYSDAELLFRPFDSLISKIHSMDIEAAVASKKSYSIDDIHTNYKKRFDLPVLSASPLNTGIFLSFEDFKNNKASYPDFKYKVSELSTDITVLQDGKPVAITGYWGFFDGKDLFVRPGFVPFKVMRQGNTFDMLGALTNTTRHDMVPLPLPGVPVAAVPVAVIPGYPLQVDMETGKVY